MKSCAAVGLLIGVLTLAGCSARIFETSYDHPVDPAAARGWRLAAVEVTVPEELKVSEEHSYEPDADIVWREDPIGDRYAQVDKIMTAAITRGASGLKGSVPVRLDVTIQRFDALGRGTRGIHMEI